MEPRRSERLSKPRRSARVAAKIEATATTVAAKRANRKEATKKNQHPQSKQTLTKRASSKRKNVNSASSTSSKKRKISSTKQDVVINTSTMGVVHPLANITNGMVKKSRSKPSKKMVTRVAIHGTQCVDGVIFFYDDGSSKHFGDPRVKSMKEIQLQTNEKIIRVQGKVESRKYARYHMGTCIKFTTSLGRTCAFVGGLRNRCYDMTYDYQLLSGITGFTIRQTGIHAYMVQGVY